MAPNAATDGFSPDQVLGGRFRLIERLGGGAFGSIWKATMIATETTVCLKVLKNPHPNKRLLQRFQQESRALARLEHPHIVKVLAFETSKEGRPFLVTEFVDGQSLGQLLESQGPLPESRALAIFKQIAETLEYAHSQGVLHRDIKPDNVMLSVTNGKDSIKIVDFGIAHVQSQGIESLKITKSGSMLGSPSYASPELNEGKKASARSDVYAFGCLMYEVLTGKRAFEGDTAYDTYLEHVRCDRNELVSPIANDRLADVIKRSLAVKPERRFRSMADLLDEWPDVVKFDGRHDQKPRRKSILRLLKMNGFGRKESIAVGCCLGLVVLSGLVLPFWKQPQSVAEPTATSREHFLRIHEQARRRRMYPSDNPEETRIIEQALQLNSKDHLLTDRQIIELEILLGLALKDSNFARTAALGEDVLNRCLANSIYERGLLEALQFYIAGHVALGNVGECIPLLQKLSEGCSRNAPSFHELAWAYEGVLLDCGKFEATDRLIAQYRRQGMTEKNLKNMAHRLAEYRGIQASKTSNK
jgi:eukaryotic-like serine/threonine-protein kinase